MRKEDFKGRKYGRLTVLFFYGIKNRKTYWNCKCECGKEIVVWADNLKRGHTLSCGCYRDEQLFRRSVKHGFSGTVEYIAWKSLKARCKSTTNEASKRNYADRGIVVCEGWLNSFENFYADMGHKPMGKYSVERIDNNMNYSCGKCHQCLNNKWKLNCEWGTPHEQTRNTRQNRWLEYDGMRLVLEDWARVLGIYRSTLSTKLRRGANFQELAYYYLQEHAV